MGGQSSHLTQLQERFPRSRTTPWICRIFLLSLSAMTCLPTKMMKRVQNFSESLAYKAIKLSYKRKLKRLQRKQGLQWRPSGTLIYLFQVESILKMKRRCSVRFMSTTLLPISGIQAWLPISHKSASTIVAAHWVISYTLAGVKKAF